MSKKGKPDSLDRRARVEQMRAEQRRADRRRTMLTVGTAVIVGLAIIAVAAFSVYNANQDKKQAAVTAKAPIDGVKTYGDLTRNHVTTSVTYPQTPPVGGNHLPVWLNCGIYTSPIPDGNAVHSLEHGAVWIAYQPDLPEDQVTTLDTLVEGQPYVILAPYEELDSPIVATAWGVQLKVASTDDPRLSTFVTKYEQGPQTPEPGAACTGGVGTTG